jgi:4-hydroxybenzoate polyprenyltransferase
MSLLIVGIFDIIPAISTDYLDEQRMAMAILLQYGFFAFLINLIREIVKDIQDINGDKNGGMNTLAIAMGRDRTNYIVFGLAVLTLLLVISYMYVYLYNNQAIILYFLLLIIAPLLYFCVRAWSTETPKDHAFLSVLLKIIMFLGMCSILLYPNVILN